MNPVVVSKERGKGILRKVSDSNVEQAPRLPTVLVATIDPAIRGGLTDLFQGFSLNTIWSKGVEAAKNLLAKERIVACLCGFWLQDGTYRELFRYIRREQMEIPVIIVSAPACPDEYGDYLAATNIGALNFLSYPYRKNELERMLLLAMEPRGLSMRQRSAVIHPDLNTSEAA
jgi:DNA-binding NtrC family response regulator